ncbi:MAG: hypothetical protein OEL87_02360 [Nanoarchaeota archaeon]|nr:hypothetical protein [Nanoarchaeota archaeon]
MKKQTIIALVIGLVIVLGLLIVNFTTANAVSETGERNYEHQCNHTGNHDGGCGQENCEFTKENKTCGCGQEHK